MNLFIINSSGIASLLSSPNSQTPKIFSCMHAYIHTGMHKHNVIYHDPKLNILDFMHTHCLFVFLPSISYVFHHLLLLLQGVQPLLDGVINYLPCPIEVSSYALDQTKNEEKVPDSYKVYPCFALILWSCHNCLKL